MLRFRYANFLRSRRNASPAITNKSAQVAGFAAKDSQKHGFCSPAIWALDFLSLLDYEMNDDYKTEDIKVIDLYSKPLPEVIVEIEKRPLMWLPEKHIKYLGAFLNGYIYGKGCKETSELMSGFNRFVEKKYSITTTHGWVRNIDHMSSDPHKALERFFELFKEYMCKLSEKI